MIKMQQEFLRIQKKDNKYLLKSWENSVIFKWNLRILLLGAKEMREFVLPNPRRNDFFVNANKMGDATFSKVFSQYGKSESGTLV